MQTNHDDLEAVLLRAAELDRANDLLRVRNAALEATLKPVTSEAEVNNARLAGALEREREEEAARERARDEEAQLRALAKLDVASVETRSDAPVMVLTLAVVGAIVAGASGSVVPIAIVGAFAVVVLVASLAGRSARR